MIRKSAILLGAALILLGCVAYLGTQVDTGSINGRVTDKDGMPIPGVSVTIIGKNIMSGKIATQTDTDGVYRFPAFRRRIRHRIQAGRIQTDEKGKYLYLPFVPAQRQRHS